MAEQPKSSMPVHPPVPTKYWETEEELLSPISGKLGRRVTLEDIENAVGLLWSPPYDAADVDDIVERLASATKQGAKERRRPRPRVSRPQHFKRIEERLNSPALPDAVGLIRPLLSLPTEGLSGPHGEFWKDRQERRKLLRQRLEGLGRDCYDWERRLAVLTFAVGRWLGAPCTALHSALADLIVWGDPLPTPFIVETVKQETREWGVTNKKAVEDAILAVRVQAQDEEAKRLQEARKTMDKQGVSGATAAILLTQRPLPVEEDAEAPRKKRLRRWSDRDLLLPLFVFNNESTPWEAIRVAWNRRFPKWRPAYGDAVRVAYGRSLLIFSGLGDYPPLRALPFKEWARDYPRLKDQMEGILGPSAFENGVAID